ncbi:hypothetical protein [Parafrankia sp. BMG5.11]|uniref:hypothetical protein n=1 Tax=Parafrankia sp. BMG5.11 TaxID=222540 RepID=UPI00140453F3|nr:hypothetical protein [Parafrankia sp. BMG5.11]
MQTDARPARHRYYGRAQALVNARQADMSKLARTMSPDEWNQIDRGTVRAAVLGTRGGKATSLPSRETVEALDRALAAQGELVALWRDAMMEDTAIRIGLQPPAGGLPPARSATVDSRAGEVRATDRRELFELGGGFTAAAVFAATGDVGAQLDQAQPATMALADCRTALAHLEQNLWSLPPADLFPDAFEAWQTVETMLARRVHPGYTHQLVLLAGQLAAGLATVTRFGGNLAVAARFAALAERHAAAVDDPLLTGRVAGIQSCVAFNDGQYAQAADIAARARPRSHPAQRARLAAYEAQAAAANGDPQRADQAVGEMRAGMHAALAGPALTWNDAEEDLYTAITYSHIPDQGRLAITHGTRAAATFGNDLQGIGLAHVAVARGHLAGDRPAPAAAAEAGLHAVAVLGACPNAVVADRLRQHVLVPLTRIARDEPAVLELTGRIADV